MVRISKTSGVYFRNQEKKDESVPMEVKGEEAQVPPQRAAVERSSDVQTLRAAQMKPRVECGGQAEMAGRGRCKVMMEVVLKENGKWLISKLETEHNHSLSTPTSEEGSTNVPISIGTAFDSVEAARTFYYGYGCKLGFRTRTGSNRRSAATGDLIMQRFLCWRGNYPLRRRNLETCNGNNKREILKKRGKLLENEEEREECDGDVVEVFDVNSSVERAGVAENCFGTDDESMLSVKSSVGDDCGVEIESGALGKGTILSEFARAPAAKPPVTSVSAKSKLLRDLGVRVYRYSSDEKRDIILRYLMKKSNRQSGERTIKFFTTQPLPAENFQQQQNTQLQQNSLQQQEARGKLNGWAPLQTCEKQDKGVARKPKQLRREISGVVEEPKIGMFFANEDRAYEFYVRYAGNVGFCVRKGWWDKTARSVTRLRVFVCSKEGFRPKFFANEAKKVRPETRTGCPARMAINLMSNGKYSVSEFVSEHNHELANPLDIQMIRPQKLSKVHGNHFRTKLVPAEYKNYLRIKQTERMQMGDAGALLEYLQKMKTENQSFLYAIQVDEDDHLTNMLWADINSIMDYDYFGDVVCFDTSYKDAGFGKPFVQFIGVNHHKQTVLFASAVVYAETVESFKWLFGTFKEIMGGRQPKTILTGQNSLMSNAVAAVFPGTIHRYCVWHIYQSALKNLAKASLSLETFSFDLSQCIFELHEEEDFLTAWSSMLERYELNDDEWLAKLYEERKHWALPYANGAFYADILNTLRREGLNSVLQEYLRPEINILHFLNKYAEFVKERRYMERETDYLTNQTPARAPTLRFLWQAAHTYTLAAFEIFKMEFELISNCLVYNCGEVGSISEYEVAIKDRSKLYFVRFDISDGSVLCSCQKFEFAGILCCHALRVLDCRNVKELAPQYLLKRWSKDAKSGLVREDDELLLQNGPKSSSLQQRYGSLCRLLYKLAARAVENAHSCAFFENHCCKIAEQVERMLQAKLLERTSMNVLLKGQSQNQLQHEHIDNENNGEPRNLSGRKKDIAARRRQQKKSDIVEVSMNARDPLAAALTANEIPTHAKNSSNQFFLSSQSVQGAYIPGHQFGLGSFQGFHGTPQFTQEFSAPVMQQQPFPVEAHLNQASEMHALQFVASSSQLEPQGGDQGHYSIPVWDFL